MQVAKNRVRALNDAPVAPAGQYVLYWMTAARRPRFNYGLQQAVHWARELKRPLIVLEALRIGYPWASRRIHRFVLEGMAANAAYFANTGVEYYPYVETAARAGSGLLEALAGHACLVVTDDFPGFFLPRMAKSAALRLAVRLEAVDSNGLLPLSLAGGRSFYNAFSFRRFMQNSVSRELEQPPLEEALAGVHLPRPPKLPTSLRFRWPAASPQQLTDSSDTLARLAIDTHVTALSNIEGGWISAQWAMFRFVERRLGDYATGRSHPDEQATSGLSPWLHFGHLSAYEVLRSLCEVEHWDGMPRGAARDGAREGFWGLSPNAESFLDELITWRELAYNTAATLPDYDKYESLPDWARETLDAHANDPREPLYDLGQLETAETHDPIWNAAQRQLVRDGCMHNYMRMLWGKKILEWSESPRIALEHTIHLNNKYALDGRDPNSYAGIFWLFGRYDRPWAPERPIFGTIRYMSSDAAKRKLRMGNYLERYNSKQLEMLTGS